MSHSSPDDPQPGSSARAEFAEPELVRGIGLAQATTLNMIDMVGVGPFITMPLVIAAAGGPQAIAGLDLRSGARAVRWAGVGRTGRSHAAAPAARIAT